MNNQLKTRLFSFFVIFSMLLSAVGMPTIDARAATITYIGDIGTATAKSTSATTLTITPTTGVTAGDDIILTIASDPLQTYEISVTDTQSNVYYLAANAVSNGNVRTYIFAAFNVNALSTSDTITITHSALSATSGAIAAAASVFRGLALAGALDQNHIGYATATTSPTSGTITTTQANELLIGAVGTEGPGNDTAGTWGTGWTAGQRISPTMSGGSDTDTTISMGYQIVSSTGTYEALKSGITSRDAASAIASFKSSCTGICYIGDLGVAQSSTSGTSLAITTKAAVQSGDDIIVNLAMDGNTGSVSVSDGTSNVYSVVADAQFTTPSNSNVRTLIIDSHTTSAVPKGSTITITHSSITARAAALIDVRGLSGTVDQTHTGTGSGTAPSSGATAVTTQADELLVGAVGTEGPQQDITGIWDNAFNTGDRRGSGDSTATNNVTIADGWKIVSATAAYTASVSTITTEDWATAIATFKGVSGPTRNLTVAVNPTGAGTTSPVVGVNPFAQGTIVNVTATPNTGYAFSNWSGACTGSGACSVTLDSDKTVTANFTSVGTHTLTTAVSPSAGGTISPAAGGHTYTSGQVVNVTATANSSYAFSSWSGACTGSGACSVTMDSDKTVTANFAGSTTFTEPELLGRPEATSVSVKIIPDANISFYYQYGTSSGVYSGQTSTTTATAATPKIVAITNLTANTKYYYRMQYSMDGGTTWAVRPENSFQTKRAVGSTFSFDITTDSHIDIMLGNTTNWTNTLNDVKGDNPDFLLDLGDTFAMDSVTNQTGADTSYQDALQYFNIVSGSTPVYLVAGNHEQTEGWHMTASTGYNLPALATNSMKKFYLNPVPDSFYSGDSSTLAAINDDHLREDYYAWTWGDALFVVIDPFWFTTTKPYTTDPGGGESDTTGSGNRWDWTLGLDQFNWLKTTLQGSSAKYKFIFAHQMVGGDSTSGQENYGHGGVNSASLVEWGGNDVGTTTNTWSTHRSVAQWGSQPIHQMMVANGVTAFFHGHDHQYAYEKLDGIVYQAVPTGSFTGSFGIYTTGGNSGETIWADSTQGPGHLKVTVGPSQTTVDFFRSGGTTSANTYTMTPNATTNYTLTANNDGHGTVTLNPSGGTYASGTTVTLTPVPSSGYTFSSWSGANSGDVINTSGVYTIVMNANKTVQANFTQVNYTLTANNDGHGTVTLNPTGGTYASGTTVTLTPAPSSGYHFSSWSGANSGDVINTSGVYTIVMNGNKTVQANFAQTTYTLTANNDGHGTVTLNPSGGT